MGHKMATNSQCLALGEEYGYAKLTGPFLAHLSRRLTGELIVYPCFVVMSLSLFTLFQHLEDFSSETAWPIKAKLRVEHPLERGTKVCINGLGHMTKMATMVINSKNL